MCKHCKRGSVPGDDGFHRFPTVIAGTYGTEWCVDINLVKAERFLRAIYSGFVYCARCGRATTQTEALTRKFNTGFSACCDENLIMVPPRHPTKPRGRSSESSPREAGTSSPKE